LGSKASASIAETYIQILNRKITLFVVFLGGLGGLALVSIALGSFDLSPLKVLGTLLGQGEPSSHIVVWNIRMPRVVAAIVAGWGLGVSGVVIQSLLKNPLGSPFTLGISHGAAFGAAFAIVVLGAGGAQYGTLRTTASALLTVYNVYAVTLFAFIGAMITTVTILLLARMRHMAPESIILAGVALSSLFVSGTILIQYFATEVELASIVFWTFGDVSRSNWHEIGIMAAVTAAGTAYFVLKQWDFNSLSAGEDVARGLGVEVDRTRLWGMFAAALVSALVVAFHGVIAFLGLLAPHIGRRLVGADHRVLIPHSCVIGAILLLLADTVGRVIVGSGTLPVGVLTSFMGAPLFLYLLIGGRKS
jgi:iron complex transport system permease protein